MNHILVIDDEPGIRNVLKDVFEDEDYRVSLAEDGYQGLDILAENGVDLVILDVWLPNVGGIDVLKKIKETHSDTEVVMISGHANVGLAVQAVKIGAFDFLEKPLSLEKTLTVAKNALKMRNLQSENRTLKKSLFLEDEMIGTGKLIMKVRELIEQSASSDSRVLITGENGTGKELVARQVHQKSKRSEFPFVEVNCAAIPETLIESELFGHEKGAFTGAIARRRGKFELAHGGTLFLDEIADMSLSTQAKILRVIQELTFERIGGEEPITVDVRLITATNKEVEREIRAKRFREDLYYRINVIPIFVPPLRDRLEDIDELVAYFMEKFRHPSGSPPKRLAEKTLDELKSYQWPGNIRELKNFIERVNIMVEGDEISIEDIKKYLSGRIITAESSGLDEYVDMKLNEAKDRFESELICLKLRQFEGNITKTAENLGIYPSNLYGKIKKFGISLKRDAE